MITAAYNRSNVLRLAIETVRWQTLQDWEHLVIGDACTDDSQEVVESFGDPRLSFHNLERNVGEQSGPNNEGARRARGRYIAYLHQDDLWLPDHLERAVTAIEETGADMVYTLLDVVKSGRTRYVPHRLPGLGPGLRYDPRLRVMPSCWLLRRETLERVGPWRYYRDLWLYPSQDWMWRAWKLGLDIRPVPALTVVMFPSGRRAGSYSERQDGEQRRYLARIRDEPDFRERELTDIAVGYRMHWLDHQSVRSLLARACANALGKISLKLGIHPDVVRHLRKSRRRGGYLDMLRRTRGLPEKSRRSERSQPG